MNRSIVGEVRQPSIADVRSSLGGGRPNSALRRTLSIGFWAVLSAALLALLFIKLNISLDDVVLAFKKTPLWLVAVILSATFLIQIVTSYRWKIAIDWLSPDASTIRFLDLLKATTAGTVLGQVLPLQISLWLGRWWSAREMRGKWIIGTTLYEQMFDLVVLCAGAVGAILAISLDASPAISFAAFALAVACGSLGVRHLLSIGHWLAARMARGDGLGSKIGTPLVAPLATAQRAPTKVLFLLSATSITKLLLLILRTIVVAGVFAPQTRLWTAAVGYPLVGLAIANPLTPGALGVAEWSWTGLLMLAGSAATAAGIAAILLRILNLSALGVVMVVLAGVDLVRRKA